MTCRYTLVRAGAGQGDDDDDGLVAEVRGCC